MREDYSINKYRSYKAIRFNFYPQRNELEAKLENEIILDEKYDYIRVEYIDCCYRNVELYLNEADDDNYISLVNDTFELKDIAISKIRAKLPSVLSNEDVTIQIILMK